MNGMQIRESQKEDLQVQQATQMKERSDNGFRPILCIAIAKKHASVKGVQ